MMRAALILLTPPGKRGRASAVWDEVDEDYGGGASEVDVL